MQPRREDTRTAQDSVQKRGDTLLQALYVSERGIGRKGRRSGRRAGTGGVAEREREKPAREAIQLLFMYAMESRDILFRGKKPVVGGGEKDAGETKIT